MNHLQSLNPTSVRVAAGDGFGVNVWDYGGDGPALLLCHCTGAMARIWDPVVARLGGRFRVLAVDGCGHGESDKPLVREMYQWQKFSRDLLAVVDAFELGPGVWAAGHSAGAAHICRGEALKAGTFSRVVLMDAIAGSPEHFEVATVPSDVTRRRKGVFETREAARERLGSKPPMRSWTPETVDSYIEHGLEDGANGDVRLKCPREIEAWTYEWAPASEIWEVLPEVSFEALLVTGSESDVSFFPEAQLKRLPHAQLRNLEGASHFIPQERPDEVAEIILEWF